MLKRFIKKEKGQAMVEFALITPLLILLLCGIIDFGWIFGNQLILNNAGRDTARYMAIKYNTVQADKNAEALGYLTPQLGAGTFENLSVTASLSGSAPNQSVRINASYKLYLLTPVLSTFLGGQKYITIDTFTTMRLE